jgi:hypothetical protein
MKLDINNTAEIQTALDTVNGKATAFTVHAPGQVSNVAILANTTLRKAGVTEAESAGTIVTYRPAGPWANAYKNSAISTLVTLKKTASGWNLIGVKRVDVYPRNTERFTLKATDKATLAAARRLLKSLGRDDDFELVEVQKPGEQIAA